MRIANGLALLSVLAMGCGGTTGSADPTSQYALDTTDVNSSEAAVLTSAVPTALTVTASDDIAALIASDWAGNFTPAGCATSTAVASTVTLTLDGCTGPYGLVSATGTVNVDVTAAANGFTGVATATALKLNNASVDINASFTYSNSNGSNSLSVQASGDAVGPRGNHLTRNGSYTITWGSGCITINGTWTTTIAAIKYMTTITDYGQCEGECPQAGGDVSWTGADRTFDIEFNGTNMVPVSFSGPFVKDDSTATLLCSGS